MSFPSSPRDNDCDSPLSALASPQSSFETNEAQYNVKYSWSGGTSTVESRVGGSTEFGQEVSFVNEADEVQHHTRHVLRELSYGATPRAGTLSSMHDNKTPKAGTSSSSRYNQTPKAGTISRNVDPRESTIIDDHRASTSTAIRSNSSDQKPLATSTPSWDLEKTFSFRKNEENETEHRPQASHSSFSGIWDFISAIGLSREESMQVDEEGATVNLTESKENDLFAWEVGLMFSADEGDTINDPSTLCDQTFSASLTLESSDMSANHSPAYDLAKYLKYRRENGLGQYNDDTTKGDESLYTVGQGSTVGQSTIRDEHGNMIPQNAKMILGYENAKRKKNNSRDQYDNQINERAFPTIKKADGTNNEEMERRLRELAGQISADWRGSEIMPPALARRLRDFQFAREKRRKKYGKAKPWGILGLYDHLSGVKIDVEWAEDAAWRRKNKKPYLTWGDHEGMKNEGFNRPFFTFLIVSACTAMMFTSFLVNDWKFEPLSVNPMFGPSAETLLRLGAKDSYLIVVQQEVWRLVSPMVLHAGLIHYVLNMFALWFVGKAVEQIHGFFPAVVQFVVPAIGGTILSAIFLPEYITVGASGGIFGLIGACISDIIINWNLLFNEFVNERGARISHARVLIVLFLDILLNCLIGLTPFVDNFTHLGGMCYGFLCGLSTIQLVSPKFFGDDRQCFHKSKLFFFRSFGLLVCMAGIIASSIALFSGDGETNPCTSCTMMSCMTFPPWTEPNDKWWYCDDCSKASAEGTIDTETGKFIELNLKCPSGSTEVVDVDDSWPQDEIGLEGMLPMLCREHCLW